MRVLKTIQPIPVAALEANGRHAEAFGALAHLSRLRLFFFLVRASREVAAGEIQEALEIPAATLSHHLDILRRAGLIESRKEARFVYYRVNRGAVSELVRLLTACC